MNNELRTVSELHASQLQQKCFSHRETLIDPNGKWNARGTHKAKTISSHKQTLTIEQSNISVTVTDTSF
jgi:hypothetical protein